MTYCNLLLPFLLLIFLFCTLPKIVLFFIVVSPNDIFQLLCFQLSWTTEVFTVFAWVHHFCCRPRWFIFGQKVHILPQHRSEVQAHILTQIEEFYSLSLCFCIIRLSFSQIISPPKSWLDLPNIQQILLIFPYLIPVLLKICLSTPSIQCSSKIMPVSSLLLD